jgi:phosphopantothenoylcysteine decarboxylase/phosphopantothenate--cysteine ligase
MPRVVLGVSGGIGAYKACEILRDLQKRGVEVRVAMTANAARFVTPLTFEALTRFPVFLDQFALGEGGDIRHVQLADEADLFLVAPATANVLAKFAAGIADDALTTLYLATKAPVMVAPAMNVNMFEHPTVVQNLETLRNRGVRIVEPGSGYLACGWLGKGRLAEVHEIVASALSVLAPRGGLERETVVVTAGPTHEDLDPVRFLSNRSSGRMGFELAEAARDRGATVTLVSGPVALPPPQGVEVLWVRSAREMARVVLDRAREATTVVMAAAVSDYRPKDVSPHKIKKGKAALDLPLVRNPDILAELGKRSPRPFLVGFAAETDSLVENARKKREAKRADLLVANPVGLPGLGFGSERNSAVLIDATGETSVADTTKQALAHMIWDRVIALKGKGTQ